MRLMIVLPNAKCQMQDKELYPQILVLASPWTVECVKLDVEASEILVKVEYPRGRAIAR
jgi:hypothetical protein